MQTYPKELKASLIARMLPPQAVPVMELAHETGIPKDTLYTWRLKARRAGTVAEGTSAEMRTSEEKFHAVLETANLTEIELGEYCRNRGLFPAQVRAWRQACMEAHAPRASREDRETLRSQAKELKQLKAELRRKEKALAETAALLVLQKKTEALLADPAGARSTRRRGTR